MRRILTFFFFVCFSGTLFSQLASWNLTTVYTATQTATYVNALPFTFGSGTSAQNIGTSGAYCSSWTTNTTPDLNDYFQVAIAPQPGYRLNINTIAFSERRSLSGPGEYLLVYSTDPNFTSPVTLNTYPIPDNDLSRDGTISGLNIIVSDGDTLYMRWYGYKSESGAGTWRINASTLFFDGTVSQSNPNDNNSYAVAPVVQAPSLSIVPATGGFNEVFRFVIVDAGTSDGLPTDVTFLNIVNANPAGGAAWTQVADSFILKQGASVIPVSSTTVTNSNIFFTIPPGSIMVGDDNNLEISLYVQLSVSGITDGTTLQFSIPDQNPGWDAAITGSGFDINFPAEIFSSIHTIDVQATHYTFAILPPSIWQNVNFQIIAVATDDYDNADSGYDLPATLSLDFGNGNLTSVTGLTQNFSAGVFSLNDVNFDGTDWLRIKLQDVAQTFTAITTPLIYSAPDNVILDDNFNDGDYPVNPVWIGTTVDFIITTDTMLHLFTVSTDDDTSYVVSPVSYQADSVEWSALIKLDFNPSSSNWTRYYLVSDLPDLTIPVNGYYIQIGETDSTDAIEMFRMDNGFATSVMRGPDGQVAESPEVRIKVVGYNNGDWKLYADLTGNFGYQLIATANDNTYMFPRFFSGFYARYTKTYASGKFYFDDAYCGPIRVDTIPPSVVSVSLTDSATLDLVFSEAIPESDAQNVVNYIVSNSIGNPVAAVQMASDKTRITLTFSPAFTSGTSYTLSITGLHDLSGNEMPLSQHNFSFYRVNKFDVEINEILADPAPPLLLPEWEYLELFNRTAYNIELNQWTIRVGTTIKTFPVSVIPAGGYIILTHENAISEFQSYGTVLGLFTSSTMLTNLEAEIELKDKEGRQIHTITYSDSWFDTGFKKEGGWSLEQIDPANPCGEGSNWKESSASSGGTPGSRNSVYAPNPDLQSPVLLKAILTPPDTVYLYFNEIIDTTQVYNMSLYSVDNNVGNPLSAAFSGTTGKVLKLCFNHTFGYDTIFTLTVSGQIRDCVGNIISANQTARFAFAYMPETFDIVVNEVLFDPRTDGVDFVEVYNRSQKVFNLYNVRLVSMDGNIMEEILPVTNEGQYIFPGDYMVITTDPAIVSSQYDVPNPQNLVSAPSIPSYNNDAGRVMLMSNLLDTLDDFTYSDQMQFQLLSSFDGVSLERVNYNLPTQDANNWHSAAQNVGFATPTYKNSQYAEPGSADGEFSLEPEIFSPDMDGYNDVLYIHYDFAEPDYVANVVIYNAAGKIIRTLVANELLSTHGFFTWDGLDNNNNKALLGLYVVYAEVFGLTGNVKHFKKTCVVAGKNE